MSVASGGGGAGGADYNQWLSELDKYAASSAAGGGGGVGPAGLNASSSGVGHKGRLNAVEQLEQEMKLLQWHKLANEAALKAALIRTKRLRDKDRRVSRKPMAAEKAAWMQRVVEEEQMKPLEVTDDFIRQYEEQERKESEKLEQEVERHIKNLQTLKNNLTQREEQTRRHAVFRKKKKLLEETPIVVGDTQPAGDGTAGPSGKISLQVSEAEAGETVAASLNKLVELEQRIAQLELNDRPPSSRRQTPGSRLSARSGGSSSMGGSLVFRKKRTATRLDAPARTVYSVQMADSRNASSSGRRMSAGSRRLQQRARARQQRQARERKRNERQGAIINNWMSERKAKQAARRRQNQRRVVTSKARAAAARRQYNRLSSKSNTSNARSSRARAANNRRNARNAPAARARQQFRDVRRQFESAKDNARRSVAAARSGYRRPAAGRRTTGARRRDGSTRGRWADKRKPGLDASRASGNSFRFSTRRSAATSSQVGSRLGGSRASRTATRRSAATRTQGRPLHQTERRPQRRGRTRRSGAAVQAAARAAARRRAAAAAASQRHATRRSKGRSTGFGTSSRFRGKARRPRNKGRNFAGGVAGRGVAGRRAGATSTRKRPGRQYHQRGTRARTQPRATTLPTIGRRRGRR